MFLTLKMKMMILILKIKLINKVNYMAKKLKKKKKNHITKNTKKQTTIDKPVPVNIVNNIGKRVSIHNQINVPTTNKN